MSCKEAQETTWNTSGIHKDPNEAASKKNGSVSKPTKQGSLMKKGGFESR